MQDEPVDNPDDEPVYRPAYLKQWRTYRGRQWNRPKGKVTLDELSQATGLSEGFLSEIERGKKDGSRKSLEKIARALRCSVGDLLNVDPLSHGALWDVWEQLRPQEKAQGIELLNALIRGRR
jgi:DNA-binding Xre family transcriptional regulator